MDVGERDRQPQRSGKTAHGVCEGHGITAAADRNEHAAPVGQKPAEQVMHGSKDRVARGPHSHEPKNKKTLTVIGQGERQVNVPKKAPKDKAGCASRQFGVP
jgi:hypothetical protein